MRTVRPNEVKYGYLAVGLMPEAMHSTAQMYSIY